MIFKVDLSFVFGLFCVVLPFFFFPSIYGSVFLARNLWAVSVILVPASPTWFRSTLALLLFSIPLVNSSLQLILYPHHLLFLILHFLCCCIPHSQVLSSVPSTPLTSQFPLLLHNVEIKWGQLVSVLFYSLWLRFPSFVFCPLWREQISSSFHRTAVGIRSVLFLWPLGWGGCRAAWRMGEGRRWAHWDASFHPPKLAFLPQKLCVQHQISVLIGEGRRLHGISTVNPEAACSRTSLSWAVFFSDACFPSPFPFR